MPDSRALTARQPRRRWLLAAIAIVVVVGLVVLAQWPVTTAVGYNYVVTVKRLTLFEKTVAFVDRDMQMRRLTKEIGGASGSQEARLLRFYEWVRHNIHPAPPGFPIVDDHVLSIFVRHYGADDQRAEALAAIASYDGMPATAVGVVKGPKMRGVQLTLVQLGERVVVFDVNNEIVFRTASGGLATLDDLKRDASIIQREGGGRLIDGVPYHEHFAHIGSVNPRFLRMEDQRFWPRLKNELFARG